MPASPFSPWMAVAFLIFGGFFAVSGATVLIRGGPRRQRWRSCAGTVVSSRLDDGQFRFQVAFDYDGREIRFWNPYTTSVGIDPVGRDVTVLVNPADPTQAVVGGGQSRPELTGVGFLVFGVVAMVIGAKLTR
jgi:hypothetical protein